MRCIGFVGAGNMARAHGWRSRRRAVPTRPCSRPIPIRRRASASPRRPVGGRRRSSTRFSPQPTSSFSPSSRRCWRRVLDRLAGKLRPEQIVVSIAAGFTLGGLVQKLGAACRLVRAMPNTPAMVREGMTVLVGGGAATAQDLEVARQIFTGVGDVVVVGEEALLDAVTAVSGSGPGFVFAFAEAWLRGAEAAGLAPELAERLVKQTLVRRGRALASVGGARRPLARDGDVARRNHARRAGGARCAGLRPRVGAAIEAATRRSKELSAG